MSLVVQLKRQNSLHSLFQVPTASSMGTRCFGSGASLNTSMQFPAGVSKLPEKRMQPVPAEGEPQKVARTGQTTPRGEAPSATAGGQSHWYRPPILIQQRSNSEPRDMLGLSAKSAEPQRYDICTCQMLQEKA